MTVADRYPVLFTCLLLIFYATVIFEINIFCWSVMTIAKVLGISTYFLNLFLFCFVSSRCKENFRQLYNNKDFYSLIFLFDSLLWLWDYSFKCLMNLETKEGSVSDFFCDINSIRQIFIIITLTTLPEKSNVEKIYLSLQFGNSARWGYPLS